MARRIGSDGTRTRIAIRDAAIRLIARVGYEALSMRRLAEEVGLGAAALYRYFPTKQAMLFDLLEGHMDDLLHAWADADPGPKPSRISTLNFSSKALITSTGIGAPPVRQHCSVDTSCARSPR